MNTNKAALSALCVLLHGEFSSSMSSGVSRNFVRGGRGSTNSVEDREKGDLGALAS